MLLEAAEQRGQAGAAADRHDPRAAGEEPLLVDHLDHRLVAVPQRERIDQGTHELVRADEEQREAQRAGDQPPELVRQELEGEEVEDRAGRAAGLRGRGDLAEDVGDAEGEDEQAGKGEEEPTLDADADGQPSAEIHRSSSLWKTETAPKSRSRSHAASSSLITIERWKPPVHPMAIVRRVLPSST